MPDTGVCVTATIHRVLLPSSGEALSHHKPMRLSR